MKKRIFTLVLVLMLTVFACAETVTYSDFLDASGFSEGKDQGDLQTVENDDSVCVCLSGDVVVSLSIENTLGQINPTMADAFSALGIVDINTVLAMIPDSYMVMGDYTVFHVVGETRECYCACLTSDIDNMIWIPSHGGQKRHGSAKCSKMDAPRLVTIQAAEALGYDACKRCTGTIALDKLTEVEPQTYEPAA